MQGKLIDKTAGTYKGRLPGTKMSEVETLEKIKRL